MEIFGLNIASSKNNPNGRGWIDPITREFVYLPIEEPFETDPLAPTFRELGFSDMAFPDHRAHVDPEFATFTYGHVARFGDSCLWNMGQGDILFFYASLDLLPTRRSWGLYIIGHFVIEAVLDTRRLSQDQVRSLQGFENNAHVRQLNKVVQLLIKGTRDSRLYRHALQLSDPDDNHRLHSNFQNRLSTVTGKSVTGNTWHRWLLYSRDRLVAKRLLSNS